MAKRSFKKFLNRLEETGMLFKLNARAQQSHVTLRDVYAGGRAPSIVAARRSIYIWLTEEMGMGNNEVARLFDRNPGGVSRLISKEPVS